MSILLKLNGEESRHVRNNSHGEGVGATAERVGQERLAAEPLQRQEGCEAEGFIPERFGLSFQVAVVATHVLEPGWDRHFGFIESVETLPRVVVVSGVVRCLVVVGVVPADGRENHVATLARP
jgi:hypothetical protein